MFEHFARQKDDFDFWCAEYRDNPRMAEMESLRLLASMASEGNSFAQSEMQRLSELPAPPDLMTIAEAIEKFAYFIPPPQLPTQEDYMVQVVDDEVAYSKNWKDIAFDLKAQRGWRCEVCQFQKEGSGLLQVHHINRDKTDNIPANLQVLCAICHGAKHGRQPLWPENITHSMMQELNEHQMERWRKAMLERKK